MQAILKRAQQIAREDETAMVKWITVAPVVTLNPRMLPKELPIALGRIENERATEFVF